jgi:hypothetical protein
MGVDIQIEGEDGHLIERLDDPRGCLAKFLVVTDAETTTCLRFIDPYGDVIFNSLQLPVLESEVKDALAKLKIDRLRASRAHQLAEAIRLGWQPKVIEELRRDVVASSDEQELEEVSGEVKKVLELIARARAAGAHTYLRFQGD